MFVFTFKASTLKYVGVMSLCVMAVVLTVILMPSATVDDADYSAVEVIASRQKGDFKNIKTENDRTAFLKCYGWEVEGEPSCREVTVPEEFDEIYTEYNNLQKTNGLNLEKYKGKKVTLYTYEVSNADTPAYADLLIYKNTVIAADVRSAQPDGFWQGIGG